MKVEKLEENQNKLLERKEITAVLSFEGSTPKREDVKNQICDKVGANKDLSVLQKIETSYGSHKIRVFVHVYENKDKMKEVEKEYLLKRNNLLEEPKKEEAKPAEGAKEEAPKEEKKEDPKKE